MKINREEALRYMGHRAAPDERLCAVMDECEAGLLENAAPRWVWRVFELVRENGELSLSGCGFSLVGEDIARHVDGCEKAAVLAVTLSASADRFLKTQTLSDGLRGLVSDAMASVLVEQVSEQAQREILEGMSGYNATWCYAAGYGDFPLEILPKLVECVDAARKIGVSCTASNMLTPQKSIVGIVGLSTEKIRTGARGCANCNLRDKCEYRKSGAGSCQNNRG